MSKLLNLLLLLSEACVVFMLRYFKSLCSFSAVLFPAVC